MALITAFFSSCEKCKTCQITFETLNGYSMSDLDEAEEVSESVDLTGDGTDDYRVYWDCM